MILRNLSESDPKEQQNRVQLGVELLKLLGLRTGSILGYSTDNLNSWSLTLWYHYHCTWGLRPDHQNLCVNESDHDQMRATTMAWMLQYPVIQWSRHPGLCHETMYLLSDLRTDLGSSVFINASSVHLKSNGSTETRMYRCITLTWTLSMLSVIYSVTRAVYDTRQDQARFVVDGRNSNVPRSAVSMSLNHESLRMTLMSTYSMA
jgi:hypothetical protein